MEASENQAEVLENPPVSPAASAAAAITGAEAQIGITTGTAPGHADMPPTVFDRLSIERRVLGFITDETDKSALGPRNTLHALTYGLMHDTNTTSPPTGHGRLEIDGLSVEQIAQQVLELLHSLVESGLVEHLADGSYAVSDAGQAELAA